MCGRSRCRYNSKVTRAALELELYFILIQGGLPMTFPEIVKTTLWDIIHNMIFFINIITRIFIFKAFKLFF